MLLNLRQGIIRPYYKGKPSTDIPPYLSKNRNSVLLNLTRDDSLLLVFCYKNVNYLFVEDEQVQAWNNLPNDQVWLYWDISLIDGKRTFGYTMIKPESGPTLPKNPAKDQHFFLHGDNVMYVWNGGIWKKVLRLFASHHDNNIKAFNTDSNNVNTSQVGLNRRCTAGYILYDEFDKGIKSSDGEYFLTTETYVSSKDTKFTTTTLDNETRSVRCVDNIARYHCVSWNRNTTFIELAKSNDITFSNKCIGIALHPATKSSAVRVVTRGYIRDKAVFNWTEKENAIIFVGPAGELTTKCPTANSLQRVGYVVDKHTIYVRIDNKILVNPNSIVEVVNTRPVLYSAEILCEELTE